MSGVTLGQLLMLAGALAALHGAWQLAAMLRSGGHGRGTPQYAAARDARRFAIWSFAAALVLILAGALTPLAAMPISGGAS
jgi:hypothetical protein